MPKNVEKSLVWKSYPRYPQKNKCFRWTTYRKNKTYVLGSFNKNAKMSKEKEKTVDFFNVGKLGELIIQFGLYFQIVECGKK